MRPAGAGDEPAAAGLFHRDDQLGPPAPAGGAFGGFGIGAGVADARDDVKRRVARLRQPGADRRLHRGFGIHGRGDRIERHAADAAAIGDGPAPVRGALDRVVQAGDGGAGDLFEQQGAALAQQQAEIDRLRDEQPDRDEQRHLPGKAAWPDAHHAGMLTGG